MASPFFVSGAAGLLGRSAQVQRRACATRKDVYVRHGVRAVRMSGLGEEELGMMIPEATKEEMRRLLAAPTRAEMMAIVQEIAKRTRRHMKTKIKHTSDYHDTLARPAATSMPKSEAAKPSSPPPPRPRPPPPPSGDKPEPNSTSAPAAVSRPPPAAAEIPRGIPFTAHSESSQSAEIPEDRREQLEQKIEQVEAAARALRFQSSNQAANAYMDDLNQRPPAAQTPSANGRASHVARALQDEFRRYWQEKDLIDNAHVQRLNAIISKHTQ
ncbi:hypothetical protein FVE85_9003 [Porphyridium purpureum]|uniref:Uncharacterized protein n=1 Tax=Porphyridium purpureum TaxID=35688 RepID=A0A5J4YMK9_PORPP|nr:hypothetical protein FVE85_8222 [Porphyridium purpureum]KAA8492731.1 hypothetical protein FVE85_9003 [Porphyridium purpureum]|eukprot:POR4479..scf222_8